MPSRWIEHVKEFAKKNNMSYGCALSDPNLKKGYVPTGDKKRKPEKLEMATPSTEPKPKNIVIKPRPKAEGEKEAKELHDKYLSLHRAKYTTKVGKELEIVEGKINKITQPMLKKELEKNYFTGEDGKKIRFKLIPARLGYYNTHLFFTDEDGKVIDKLTKNGKENGMTDPYTELLTAIKGRFKYRLFNRTAGLRNEEDLRSLLPNLLNSGN
jgi:hypothetical protein